MESEKVKEIKECLEVLNEYGETYITKDKTQRKFVKYADILTLINELESENERLENKNYQLEQDLGQCENGYKLELHTARYEIHSLEEDIEKLKKEESVILESKTMWKRLHTELCNENRELKDRIALLEKDNELLRNAKVVYENVDYCYEDLKKAQDRIVELEKGNEALSFAVKQGFNDCQTKTLKKFSERLKEKSQKSFINVGGLTASAKSVTLHDIDETLKEFINADK